MQFETLFPTPMAVGVELWGGGGVPVGAWATRVAPDPAGVSVLLTSPVGTEGGSVRLSR